MTKLSISSTAFFTSLQWSCLTAAWICGAVIFNTHSKVNASINSSIVFMPLENSVHVSLISANTWLAVRVVLGVKEKVC